MTYTTIQKFEVGMFFWY